MMIILIGIFFFKPDAQNQNLGEEDACGLPLMGIIPQKYRSFDYTCKKCEDGEIRSLIRTSLSYAHHSLTRS